MEDLNDSGLFARVVEAAGDRSATQARGSPSERKPAHLPRRRIHGRCSRFRSFFRRDGELGHAWKI